MGFTDYFNYIDLSVYLILFVLLGLSIFLRKFIFNVLCIAFTICMFLDAQNKNVIGEGDIIIFLLILFFNLYLMVENGKDL